jgi:hypothetical protein
MMQMNERTLDRSLARSRVSPRPYNASPSLGCATRSVRFDKRTVEQCSPSCRTTASPEPYRVRGSAQVACSCSTLAQSEGRKRKMVVFPMRVVVTSLWILCLWSGCGIIMVGEPVQELDISSEDDVEENLKAVRAILADQETRRTPSVPKPSPPSSRAAPASESGPAGDPLFHPTAAQSSSAIVTGHLDAPAKLPWSPSPAQRPEVPDRPVPAYTVPAPVAPDYSGSVRCAPDGLGGQRCAGR